MGGMLHAQTTRESRSSECSTEAPCSQFSLLHRLRPMGYLTSKPSVPWAEDSQPAGNVSGTVQVPMQAQVPMPTPPAPVSDLSSSNLTRPRTRTHSQQSIRRGTERSDTTFRSKALPSPRRVKPTKPPSSQHSQHSLEPTRKRGNTSVEPARGSRFSTRPQNPGEGDSWLGYESLMTAF